MRPSLSASVPKTRPPRKAPASVMDVSEPAVALSTPKVAMMPESAKLKIMRSRPSSAWPMAAENTALPA